MHYGLVPRANRGIFAINELPDLAGKIQVGLFNILQEGDVQIKGYPVRLPLDLLVVFSANPEDYTARGKIITPLKDRIGSEIRTHYPGHAAQQAMKITAQEAWTARGSGQIELSIPEFVREVVEEVAFQARAGSEGRQAIRRQPAAADLAARERRLERRAAGAVDRRDRRRAARHRHLRGDPGDHRQVRARVRRRAEGRRQRGARPHPQRPSPSSSTAGSPTPICARSPSGSTSAATSRSTTRCRRRSCVARTAQVQGLHEAARHGRSARRPATRCSPRRSISCSRGCTPSARSAARSKASSRPPSRPSARRARSDPLTERELPLTGGKKKYYN